MCRGSVWTASAVLDPTIAAALATRSKRAIHPRRVHSALTHRGLRAYPEIALTLPFKLGGARDSLRRRCRSTP